MGNSSSRPTGNTALVRCVYCSGTGIKAGCKTMYGGGGGACPYCNGKGRR